MNDDRSLKSCIEERFLCKGKRSRWATGSGIAIGTGAGVALGVAMNNPGVGLALGIALGLAIDFLGARGNK